MGIPNINDRYGDAKQKAKLFYKGIGRVWCLVLNDWVIFNESGFRHLLQKGRRFRTKSEQKRRFSLLVHVEEILKFTSVVSEDERAGKKSRAHYWKFKDCRDSIAIVVIVRQIGNGNKHFLSIYGKKQKSAPESADF